MFGAELGYYFFKSSIFLLLDVNIAPFDNPGKISGFLGYIII